MSQINLTERSEVRIQEQLALYLEYALAAEAYGKKPTIDNWTEKEKAFENYNNALRNEEEIF